MTASDSIDGTRRIVAEATRIVVLTGAGISQPSGVPTYRQAGSGWTDERLERISQANAYGNLTCLHFPGRVRLGDHAAVCAAV